MRRNRNADGLATVCLDVKPIRYITVCKNVILSNIKHGRNEPAIRVSDGKHGKPFRVHRYEATGRCSVVCDMEHPLPWGARVWIEEEL